MTGKSVIIKLMSKHGISNSEMAERLGITRAALWSRLDPRKSDNITVNTLQDMLDVMGYEIIIAKKGFADECQNVITIGDEEDGDEDDT